jgi:hypothetical protein
VGEVPTKDIEKTRLAGAGMPLVELLVHAGLCPSKGQARKDIEGGGVNVNNVREASFHAGGDGRRFAVWQTHPAPQRQKELRRDHGEVNATSPRQHETWAKILRVQQSQSRL